MDQPTEDHLSLVSLEDFTSIRVRQYLFLKCGDNGYQIEAYVVTVEAPVGTHVLVEIQEVVSQGEFGLTKPGDQRIAIQGELYWLIFQAA